MQQQWKGVFPACATPYDDDDNVDTGRLEKMVELMLADGADGLYMTGTTGESLMLTESERKTIAEVTMKIVAGRCPVIFHVGAMHEREAIELARHAEKLGASAVSAIPPVFFPSNGTSITGYYTRLAAATDVPLIVYHLPALGAGVPIETILRFAEIPGVGGMKYSDFDLGLMMRIRRELGPEFFIFSGIDEVALQAMQTGANAIIGLNYSFQCQTWKGLLSALERGDVKRAAELQRRGIEVTDRIRTPAMLDGAKLILRYRGLDVGRARRPLHRWTDEEAKELYAWLDAFEFNEKLADAAK